MSNGINPVNSPPPYPSAPLTVGQQKGKQLVEAMQTKLQNLEDVDNPDGSGQKISIENLLILLLVERSKNIGSYLGTQAQELNTMNNKSVTLKGQISQLSSIKTKGLATFTKVTGDKGIQSSLNWFQSQYLPSLKAGHPILIPNAMLETAVQKQTEKFGVIIGLTGQKILANVRAIFDHPVIPMENKDLLKDLKAFDPNVASHIGVVDGTSYIDLGYLSATVSSFNAQTENMAAIYNQIGKPVPSLSSVATELPKLVSSLQGQITILNQDSQSKVQDMTKTMHYATQYQEIAGNMLSNFNQEIMASINRIVV